MKERSIKPWPVTIAGILLMTLAVFFICWRLRGHGQPVQIAAGGDVRQQFEEAVQDISDHLANGFRDNDQPFRDTIENFGGTRLDAKRLMAAGKKLVLEYSELTCNVCVDTALSHFLNFSKKVGEDKVMLLVRYRSIDYLNQFIRVNHIRLPHLYKVIASGKEDLDEPPHLFILDGDLRMKDVFYPMKEVPVFSMVYYKAMLEKHFSPKL